MDKIIEELMQGLSKSPTDLSEKNIKKIYEYIPVPNDFKILWADINEFGNYPSGIVITDKGIVSKAPHIKSEEDEKKKEKRKEVYKIPYQIILWKYFDPSDYSIEKSKDGSCYVMRSDENVVSVFSNDTLYTFFEKYNHFLRNEEESIYLYEGSVVSELETLNLESAVFNAAYGVDQSKTGHGIYAEEAGSILDKLHGEDSTVEGRNNKLNGPDKLVNGKPVQCKFCKTGASSVAACFKKNPSTGKYEYRYKDVKSGKPMMVEVPKDQYDRAVEAMKRRIADGQVPGVTDPEMAKELIRKSKLTYSQAKNLAKAGTIESLSFDAVTGVVNCSCAAGISSLVSFGTAYWSTKDIKKARDSAIDTAINVFGPSFAANIITNQIARTGLSKSLIPLSEKIVKKLGSKTVQNIINARRALLGQGKIYGNAAAKSLAKALRGNVITEGISLVCFSIPDTYRVSVNKISKAQYTQNMLSSLASVLCAIGGANAAGFAAGKIGEKLGKKVNKKVGAAIGFVAGMGGGFIGGLAVNKLAHVFREDDCIITTRMFNAIMVNMIIDNYLNDNEINELVSELDKDSNEIIKFQPKIYQSKCQDADIQQFLTPYFENINKKRELITVELENQAFEFSESEIKEVEEGA